MMYILNNMEEIYVGDLVRSEVKQIFGLGKVLEYLNKTLITLIPKYSSLNSLSNYKLVNLCNFVYKVVTNLIVAHIRPLLAGLVSPLRQILSMVGRVLIMLSSSRN